MSGTAIDSGSIPSSVGAMMLAVEGDVEEIAMKVS